MPAAYSIALAQVEHLAALPAIELAAASLLVGHAPRSALDEVTERRVFELAQHEGRLWIALAQRAPIGFALALMLGERHSHLQEMDVHPGHGRRGVGRTLLTRVLRWARVSGHRQTTLTTFRAVPWNRPFYAQSGFAELPAKDWSAELRAIVAAETSKGLSAESRCVMTWRH